MPHQIFKKNAKDLLSLSIPMTLSAATGVLTSITDSIMVGRLGVTHLAAIAVSSSIFIIFQVFMRGMASSLPTLASPAIAQGQIDKRDRLITNSLLLQFLFFLILSPILYLTSMNLNLLGQPEDIASLSYQYLAIMCLGIFPLSIHQSLQGAIEAHHNARFPMIATYFTCGMNIIGNWLLIEGNWGFPAMGIQGAAIASVISHFILMGILGVYLHKHYHCHFLKDFWNKIKLDEIKILFRVGFPFGIQWLIEVVAFGSTSIMLGAFSKTELAAHQIVLNFASLMFMIPLGLSSACTIKVSHALVSLSKRETKEYIKHCLLACWGMAFMTAACIFLFRHAIPPLYTDNKEVIQIASILMIIAGLFQITDATQAVGAGILRGMLDIKIPTLIITFVWWGITIPFCYIISVHLKHGAIGVWIGLTIGLTLSAVMLTIRIRTKTKSFIES